VRHESILHWCQAYNLVKAGLGLHTKTRIWDPKFMIASVEEEVTQRILSTATPGEIREHVKERLAVFKPGGGYVFNQVHNIQPNVPAANIIAMLDAAYEYGGQVK
jgi:uroporphyrinogen-III decarboxylase